MSRIPLLCRQEKCINGCSLEIIRLAGRTAVAVGCLADFARVQGNRPLNEANLTKSVELQVEDEAIASKLKKEGVNFVVDDAAIGRLKKAGASDAVIAAVRSAGATAKPINPACAITYQDVVKLLQLGLDEKEVLKRLENRPRSSLLTLRRSRN